ncbi:MAG: flagellar hook-associated protein FlgK [Novosphingobium sp.]|nr:flagellar hook-associated protein FlgK [Novosphingobium sp.]
MASDLLSIASSGVKTARIALDVTAQNIANVSTEGYVRRSAAMQELVSVGGPDRLDVSLSGVRLERVVRNADAFRQSEVRRTGADAARADAEVAGLTAIETAVEQSGAYAATVDFEASLRQLAADPVNTSLRAAVIEDARAMAQSLNMAAAELDAAGTAMRFEAQAGVEQANVLASELARVNLRLARAADGSSDRTSLLDQRDLLLQKLSNHADVTTTIAADQTVEVRLGGASGPLMVSGGTSATLAMATAGDGMISFTLDGAAVSPTAGSLAGKAQALDKLAQARGDLDTIAADFITAMNTAQASGADLNGNAGQPLFSGTGAADIALAASDGALIATAPAGSPAGSRDTGNLDTMRGALATADTADTAGRLDGLIFDISSTVAGRRITRDALAAIADTASRALQAQAAVDLDHEAVNLVRFQQAFQASGRVMQVANDIFDTLLGIR